MCETKPVCDEGKLIIRNMTVVPFTYHRSIALVTGKMLVPRAPLDCVFCLGVPATTRKGGGSRVMREGGRSCERI